MKDLKGACMFGQSGGPTSVINSSAAGVFIEALRQKNITAVYGAEHGIVGILGEKFYDMSKEDPKELELLKYTPSSALGSARYKLKDAAEDPRNSFTQGEDRGLAVVACGIAYNYLLENFPKGVPCGVLKLTRYPIPRKLVAEMVASGVHRVIVMEEGQPFVEDKIRGMIGSEIQVEGRLTGLLPRSGELTPDSVRAALHLSPHKTFPKDEIVMPRPPALCQGCGHRDMYAALNEVAAEYDNSRVFSDIGCYTLGALPPFRAIHTCVDMGASITMAKGAADAGQFPSFAVIGDSTFTHSGITGLLDCVNSNANVVVIISDNLTTGMTGGQDSAGTGKLESICAGVGVDPAHIRVVVPLAKNMEEIKNVIREEVEYKGVSVVIPRRECIQTFKRHAREKKQQ